MSGAKAEEVEALGCPHCGGCELDFGGDVTFAEGTPDLTIWVQCLSGGCASTGPSGATRREAIAHWNRRSSGPLCFTTLEMPKVACVVGAEPKR